MLTREKTWLLTVGLLVTMAVGWNATAATKEAPKRPGSLDKLFTRGLQALEKNDAEAFVGLMLTLDDLRTHCPEMARKMPAKLIEEMHRKARENVAKCTKLIDFSKAKEIRREHRADKRDKEDHCSGALWERDDLKVYYQVGAKTYRVKLDDPIELGDGALFVFGDDPRCSEQP